MYRSPADPHNDACPTCGACGYALLDSLGESHGSEDRLVAERMLGCSGCQANIRAIAVTLEKLATP